MVATPAGEVRAEVRDSYHGRPLPPVLEPFLTDPAAAVHDLAQLIRAHLRAPLAADDHLPRPWRGNAVGDRERGGARRTGLRSSAAYARRSCSRSAHRARPPTSRNTLGISAGGVSQHLAILRDAGLVNGHRTGRVVLYLRSPAAEDLLAAATRPSPAPPPA